MQLQDQIQLRYHRGTVYWQMPNAKVKMKAVLVGAYLGVSLGIVLACIPAWYAQMVPDPVWVKAHQSTYLWLAGAYIGLVLFVRALIRWQGLGTWLAFKFFTVIGALIGIALMGLFFGYVGAGITLMCCLGMFDCCCERERQREERITVSRRPEVPSACLSLSRGEKRLLRASVIAAGLLVWFLLGVWYMNDAKTAGFVPPEVGNATHTGLIDAPAVPEPTPPVLMINTRGAYNALAAGTHYQVTEGFGPGAYLASDSLGRDEFVKGDVHDYWITHYWRK